MFKVGNTNRSLRLPALERKAYCLEHTAWNYRIVGQTWAAAKGLRYRCSAGCMARTIVDGRAYTTTCTTREYQYLFPLLPAAVPSPSLVHLSPLLDFVTYADIDGNSILNCGLYDFVYGDEGKSGEGICEYSNSRTTMIFL